MHGAWERAHRARGIERWPTIDMYLTRTLGPRQSPCRPSQRHLLGQRPGLLFRILGLYASPHDAFRPRGRRALRSGSRTPIDTRCSASGARAASRARSIGSFFCSPASRSARSAAFTAARNATPSGGPFTPPCGATLCRDPYFGFFSPPDSFGGGGEGFFSGGGGGGVYPLLISSQPGFDESCFSLLIDVG